MVTNTLVVLLYVLWYCHKRGRETRLEKEKSQAGESVEAGDRVEELPDDPALPGPSASTNPVIVEPTANGTKLPHPPIGEHANK
jgi:hypothetical protein